eukprot:751293-Hanusia_phi.AAC.1
MKWEVDYPTAPGRLSRSLLLSQPARAARSEPRARLRSFNAANILELAGVRSDAMITESAA